MATNIDIVRTGYESFCRGDIQTARAMFAEEIEWLEPRWAARSACVFRGRDQVLRRIFSPGPEVHDARAFEAREFYGDGDTVIVTGVVHAGAGDRSETVDVPFAHVWTVHAGRIDSLRSYNDVHELVALHAARAA
jgi:uncharacterized protein